VPSRGLAAGKYSETYSIEVAKARIELLAQKIQRLVELHGTPVKEIAVVLLGDFVESGRQHLPEPSLRSRARRLVRPNL